MSTLAMVGLKAPENPLAVQVRKAAQVSPGDLVEAEKLAGLVARQLKAAGLSRAAGLHLISSLEAYRLTDE